MVRIRKAVFLIAILAVWTAVNGQPNTGDPNEGRKPGAAPISGIEWLLVGGAAFGARQLYGNMRRRK